MRSVASVMPHDADDVQTSDPDRPSRCPVCGARPEQSTDPERMWRAVCYCGHPRFYDYKVAERVAPNTGDDASAGHRAHVRRRGSIETDRRVLGELIASGNASDAEVSYYEAFSDPDARALDRDQRQRSGQYLRRLRRQGRR